MCIRDRDVALEDLAEKEEGEYCAPLEQAADRKVLLDALGRISREERQIVLLHAAAGMKHREVAEALQMPLATVLSKYKMCIRDSQCISLHFFRCQGSLCSIICIPRYMAGQLIDGRSKLLH